MAQRIDEAVLETNLKKSAKLAHFCSKRRFVINAAAIAFMAPISAFAQSNKGTDAQNTANDQDEVERHLIAIGPKESISQALLRIGADKKDVADAVRALERVIDVDDIKKGDQLTVFLRKDGNTKRLLGFNLASGASKSVTVSRTIDGNYKARELQTKLKSKTLRVAGIIGADGLLESVRKQGAPDRVADSLAEAFAFDVDFEREIGPGSGFELVFDRVTDTSGNVVREGEPLFAQLSLLSGKVLKLYRFLAPGANNSEWFDGGGKSAKKFLMRTPINGAKLTSGFGKRMHPVLGYSKMHTGVDFGAPVGTPVYCAGDGVIARASVMGGYGNVVDIEHGGGWMTRYAHLSKFKQGLKVGDKVKQGQTIALSGNTGRSTGPHLHFEIRLNGEAINPLSAKIPSGRALTGDTLSKFNAQVAKIEGLRKQSITGENSKIYMASN